jgi:nicotinamidase/pyrazinamidase
MSGRVSPALLLALWLGAVGLGLAADRLPRGPAGKVLLVIDVQEDCTGAILKPPFLYQEGSGEFITGLNALVSAAASAGVPVVYLRTNFRMQDVPGARLDSRLLVKGHAVFLKDAFDAFASSDGAFGKWMSDRPELTQLYLVGLDAMYCVLRTARGAARRGYSVQVLSDAVRTVAKKSPAELASAWNAAGIGVTDGAHFLDSLR